MPGDDNFVVTTGADTTVRGSNKKVVVPEAFSLQQNGAVVAAVDAVYDFSQVPEQHHAQLLWFISVTPRPTLLLPMSTREPRVDPEPAPVSVRSSWWSKLWGKKEK